MTASRHSPHRGLTDARFVLAFTAAHAALAFPAFAALAAARNRQRELTRELHR